ncbi:MAG: AlbA family DNA-binding domain-containing protein [Panacagrimonas sp.]
MDADFSKLQELIDRPSESLSVEIKRWIDPDAPEGIAKIVRAALALRNFGGGYLVIGFDNASLRPDDESKPVDARVQFHADKIQALVTRYASEPFGITVSFPERDGQPYPVVSIPSGIKTPVACKADLSGAGGRLLSTDDILCRTLRSNNTPSTARASWKDWNHIMEVCFESREADVGKFLRRHLSGITPDAVRELADALISGIQPKPKKEDKLLQLLNDCDSRFNAAVLERQLQLPIHGYWEVALIFFGSVPPHATNLEFLNLLDSSNPDYTGWPVWLVSRDFREEQSRPHVSDGAWEQMLVKIGSGWSDHIDFMRFDPRGRFYIRRPFQDDVGGSNRAPDPMTAFDFGLALLRVAEAMAVGVAFAKAMGCDSTSTTIDFAFRWSKLKGRELASWAEPARYVSPRKSYQDQVISYVAIPLDTPHSSLGDYVHRAVGPVFEVFNGFTIGKGVVDEMTAKLINRRL